MLVVLALLASAPLHFVEEPLPGVQVGAITPFTGLPVTNYTQADLNGDGLPDLVLPGEVYLQVGGRFPATARLPLPEGAHGNEVDVFQGAFFVRSRDGIQIYALSDGAWIERHTQALPWPGATSPKAIDPRANDAVTFRRFTYDLDGDGTAELLDLNAEGVHLFRLDQGHYTPAGVLDVLPAVTLAPPSAQSVWPPSSRRIGLPSEEMACRLLVLPGALSIVTHEKRGPDHLVFTRSHTPLTAGADGVFAAASPTLTHSSPVPSHVRPCNLNGDATLDFAGGRWLVSTATPLPMPIYETWASLDNGQSFHVERTPSFQHFRPQSSFLDYDADGDLDLITESTTLFSGGPREAMNRYLTESRLPHRVAVHRQDQDGFSKQPTVQFDLDIDLSTPPVAGGAMLDRYQRGALVNLTGDLNGDGFLDLVVRQSPDQLNIHLSAGGQSWEREPAGTIGLPANAELAIADLNGDGNSDLLLRWTETAGGREADATVAYYAGVTTR